MQLLDKQTSNVTGTQTSKMYSTLADETDESCLVLQIYGLSAS